MVCPGPLLSHITIKATDIIPLYNPFVGDNSLPQDTTEAAAASINEALISPSILTQDQHSADPLFGSLNSKITESLESPVEAPSEESFTNPEVQISGKIPTGNNADDGIAAAGALRAQVSKTNGTVSL